MSKLKKIVIIIAIVVTATIVLIQIFLQTKLNSILTGVVTPALKKNSGIDLIAKDVSVNLLGGTLNISELSLCNPPDFAEPTMFAMKHCKLDLRLLSLLRGILEISATHIDNAKLTFVRNSKNQINTVEIAQSIPEKTENSDKTATSRNSQPDRPLDQTQLIIPNILIKDLSATTMIEFIDHTIDNGPLSIGLVTSLNIRDLATFENIHSEWGSININAHLETNTNLFIADIKGKISPLTDLMHPSFSIDGTIAGIDLSQPNMVELCEEAGIKSDSASIEVNILCVNGNYVKSQSVIVIKLKNCQPVGKLAEKLPNFPMLPELSVPLPIRGTFQEPEIDNPQQIIVNTILANFAQNAHAILNNISNDKSKDLNKKIQKVLDGSSDMKIQREIDKGLRRLNLEGLFKESE